MKDCYFAVDLGATSGRTIIACLNNGLLELEEINRFPNRLEERDGHVYWDIYALYDNILEGLKIVASRDDLRIISIGIDTWGVDFVFVGKDGKFLHQPYSYRDPYTDNASEKYFSRIHREMVYGKTGIQVMNFNSLFQFDTIRREEKADWERFEKILFIPDALSYMLTGKAVTEYTIATTAQIVNASGRCLDSDILETVGLKEDNFGTFVYPGYKIGPVTEKVQELTGLGPVPVIAVCGHDTASAVAAVPASDRNFAYLSSGTWSLMGVETDAPVITADSEAENFTNEGGVDNTIRFLKNICGMWLLEGCRNVWGKIPYDQLIEEANVCVPFRSFVNPDDPVFVNPKNMVHAIGEFCRKRNQPVPQTRGQIVRCIFESLAFRYREVLEKLLMLSPVEVRVLHIIGGGSCNNVLNQYTANATGIPVVAGPSEATAIGNVMVQALADRKGTSVAELRKIVALSIPLVTYEPENSALWSNAYDHYLDMTR